MRLLPGKEEHRLGSGFGSMSPSFHQHRSKPSLCTLAMIQLLDIDGETFALKKRQVKMRALYCGHLYSLFCANGHVGTKGARFPPCGERVKRNLKGCFPV